MNRTTHDQEWYDALPIYSPGEEIQCKKCGAQSVPHPIYGSIMADGPIPADGVAAFEILRLPCSACWAEVARRPLDAVK